MDSRVKRCIQTRLHVSKKFRIGTNIYREHLSAFVLVKSVFSGMVSYVKICILRRFCKLKSCVCTSFQVGQRWNTRCDMLNVTHRRVLVSQNSAESYRGQSSWSVVLLGRGWCLYYMVVVHTYLLRHMAGKNRGQCLYQCTGGWVEHVKWAQNSIESEAECRLLLSYLLLILLLLLLLLLNVY